MNTRIDPAKSLATWMSAGEGGRAGLLLRLAVGGVFVASGAIKLLFENQGALRFAKLGFPSPSVLAYFVSSVEIVGGGLVMLGLFARIASLPLIVDMLVALATTKVPILFGTLPEPIGAAPKAGFWAFAYQARLDLVLLFACAYLVAAGAGAWSLDALRANRAREAAPAEAGGTARHLIA